MATLNPCRTCGQPPVVDDGSDYTISIGCIPCDSWTKNHDMWELDQAEAQWNSDNTVDCPTQVEICALWCHILKMEMRLTSAEVGANIRLEKVLGLRQWDGILTVSARTEEVFSIDCRTGTWVFTPAPGRTFDECCQWMMFSRRDLDFDYLEFSRGWKPWKKEEVKDGN